jgi:hypothetical protein
MGLFENLFKNRPEGSVERVVEAPLKASSQVAKTPATGGETPPDPAAAFLQPKGYAPGSNNPAHAGQQGFMPVLPSAKRPPAPDRKPAPGSAAPEGGEYVVLTVGDVLPRIPVSFLRPGPYDLKRPLRFHVQHLSSDITRGRPAIALSCIAEQCPELFQKPIDDAEDMAIKLPLQKLVEQVAHIRSRHRVAAAPTALSPARPPLPAPPTAAPPFLAPLVGPAPSEAPPPVVLKRPAAPPPVVPPAAIPEPPVVERRTDPAPVAPTPAVAEVSAPPVAPAPPAEPLVKIHPPEPAEKAPAVPAPSAAEVSLPNQEAIKPPAVEIREPEPSAPVPEVPSLAEDILLAPAAVGIEETEPSAPAAAPEPAPLPLPPPPAVEPMVHLRPANEPLPTPPEPVAPGSLIHLSLAAILPTVPREIVLGGLPQVSEGFRISLPFTMIERQLGTGRVEVPSAVFIAALPALLSAHFAGRAGVMVPLPLEEIFQNLPIANGDGSTQDEAPVAIEKPAAIFEIPATARHESAPEPLPVEEPPALAPAVEEAPPVLEPVAELEPVPPIAPPVPVAEAGPAAPVPPAEPAPVARTSAESEPSSAVSAAPDRDHRVEVHLQPFRIFAPPTPTVEAPHEPAPAESVVLGEAPAEAAAGVETPHILRPSMEGERRERETDDAAGAESAEECIVTPPAVKIPLPAEPAPDAPPQFAVLPSPAPDPQLPEPAARPPEPEPEPLVAFNPDQPPPLKIEAPAAAVAVLRATVPGPQESPVFASANISVQPPKIFRPVVLPPPISGHIPATPAVLAPTLGGLASVGAGMISLAPAPEALPVSGGFSAPPRAPEILPPPAAVEPEPVVVKPEPASPPAPPPEMAAEAASPLKDLVRRLFSPSAEAAAPVDAPAEVETPAPAAPEASSTKSTDAPLLHLPPLPQATPPAPAPHEPAPPALPMTRFDQHSLQSLFMTDEMLDLPKVSRLAAALPGIQACVIASRGETFSSGRLPDGFHLSALRGLSPQVGAAADRLPIGELKNFTLYGEQYSISFFERPAVCLCAIHRARSFVPGVREKLVAVVDELARS